MINRLRRKFILISTVSVVSVVLLVFLVMTAFNVHSMNRTVDILADNVSKGGGRFPEFSDKEAKPERKNGDNDFITPETRFSTRCFTVWLDKNGEVEKVNIEFIVAVTEEEAVEYAKKAISGASKRAWISNYRYKISETQTGNEIVFVDGTMNKVSFLQSTMVSAVVLIGCAVLVLALIVLLSKRMVRPVAESYEKQKRFITDANHELKTPLTLILANLDIAEAELGKNEWLNDIRIEGHRMTELVNQLVALSNMDEEKQHLNACELSLSDMLLDMCCEFKSLAEAKGKRLFFEIEPNVILCGDEALLRRLVSVLLDNAVKYCDTDGEIKINLSKSKKIVLTVENTYKDVEAAELDRLFERFYRADKARSFTGGYGIGLSIAKAIVEKHNGEINAYKKDSTHIGFKVVFKH